MMAFQLTTEPAICSWFRTLLQGLAPILSSKDLLSFWDIDPQLKMFQEKMSKVQDLLNNAEQRSQEICVSNWMDNLRELLYDTEDFVDEMNIERVRMEQQVAIRNQSIPSHHVAYTFWDNIADNNPQKDDIKKRLDGVLARLDDVVMKANEHELNPVRVGEGSVSSVKIRVDEDNVGTSVDESDVYGREKDKDRIIEQLLNPTDSSRKNYAVISILGTGGLGKTTLAKLIFNDQRIKDNFGTRSWACVSDVFDFNRVVKELTEFATDKNVFNMAPAAVCRRLETAVQDKKILIVLDDVWEAKAWDRLKASFTRCASGSKILVTTRDKNVGDAISNKEPYELGILEDEHCWNLFEEKAFAFGEVIDRSLEKIGRGIVKKCRGIPLAVKVIGSSLRFVREEKMWERALNSELWQSVDQAKEEIFPALKLSYHYLPSPLKRCFGYLSLFPTDFYLNQQHVVRLWIAEGLVESRADMLWEDIGNGYYHELQRRCLIQKDDKMHDLILSLARYVVSSKFSYSCAANGSTALSMHLGSIRHLSLIGDDHLDLNAFKESKHLCTFLLFTGRGLHKIPEWSLRLRVLDLGRNFVGEELPDFIGSLKHLRYLNLSWNEKLKELPDSICKLHHLQALDLYLCSGIRGLPSDIGNLGSLRYLRLSYSSVSVLPSSIAQLAGLIELDLNLCNYLTCIPEDIGSLQNLRTLDLCGTSIVSLPDSIFKLQKLQVLDLSYCWYLFNLSDQIGCLGGLRMLNLQCTPLYHLPKSIGKLHKLRSLNVHKGYSGQATQLSEDICNLSSLEDLVFDVSCVRMPQGIGKLRNLKRVPEYSVGKEAGRGIEELKDMNKLEGSLSISQLENVESVEKALSANLKSKVYINELHLQWRSSPGNPSASDHEDNDTNNGKSEMEEKVLDALEPHPKGLKGLSLLNYHGGKTPKWMSDLRLPSLKKLRMEGLVCMERVMDIELPSLESLKIKNCPELRVVSMGLPNLKTLLITRCQELKALCMSPSLIIQDCSSTSDHRSYSRIELPQLVEIRLEHCPSLRVAICMTMPKLEGLIMEDCGELTLMGFTDIVLEGGPSSDIEIKNYKGRWLPLPAEDDKGKAAGSTLFFPNVGRLLIENCPNLAVLPKALHTIASLRTLDIINCPQLASFPELPPMLERLVIESCTNLQHLPTSLGDLTYLKDLRMEGLVCMERVMDIELPSLVSLQIENCPKLRVVSMVLPNLKKLLIRRCQELKALCMSPSLIIQDCSSASVHRSYSRMELPQLVGIRMEHCPSLRAAICMTMPKLEGLFMDDCGELTLMGFTDIVLEGGPSSNIGIKNYKGRWLPLLAEDDEDKAAGSTSFFPNLGRLQIENCPNLAVLPKALHTIASLRTLYIINCPQLASFPELPPKLECLYIKSCTNLQHLPTSLGDLTYLKDLRMKGLVCMETVMDIELPSLVSLQIENCPELRVVSMVLPNLKKLLITRCQELKALCMSPSLIIQDCSSASVHRSYSRMELPQLVKIRMKRCPSLRVAICMTMPKLEGLFIDDCGELTLMGFTDIVLEGGPSSDIEIKNYQGRWLPLLAEDDEDKAAGSPLFFPNVRRLRIENCPNLAVLPMALHTIASLWTLYIINCPQLASFPELPPKLECLYIKSCTNLQHLPTCLGDLTNLQLIHIIDCPRLEARPEDRLPPNPERICFFNCPQIKEQLKREERKDWLDRSTFESQSINI